MWLVSFPEQWLSAFQEVILGKWGLQVNFGPYLYFDTPHIAVLVSYIFPPLSSRDKKNWVLGLVGADLTSWIV